MPRKSTRPADTVRLLELLWTPSEAVGRSGVSLEAVTEAAVTVADADGLEAVTMRRVAQEVGIGAMSLYTYVPGRPELVELMLDSAASRVYADRPLPADQGGWRAGIEYVVWSNWDNLREHPWVTDVPPGRPLLGPGVSIKFEHEIQPLDGIGLDDHAMNHLLTTVLSMTSEAARWQAGLDRIRDETELTDEEWWRTAEPVLTRAMEGLHLPIAARVGETVASAGEPEASLRYGLGHLLDGVAATL
ncbi:TetR/AcrR family transcriptional regulator [Luteipulveratus mongoliensis]|uniref:HTH tetR-type domain-containing protein n=1 Tax=Luteipulveratus mongoliensis TaxID=571913 RepID=A0A0K1JHZ4_9MICO|nr:TetR/AcrR family transcriptional regulator C-terminal domain-containing protein [Luteipulveratus mongoliensis]AKU16331.1 hypothetical protein VV02_11435 [Luteipulveratus mongoliensis]